MKKTNQLLNLALVAILSVSCTSKKAAETSSEWTNLLDENLSQWRIYQKDIGYDVNEKNVFSVVKDNGELVLHNTGEIYGCIFTKQDFRNYHLKLQYKFGTAKYPPREDKARDSGILYHSQGEAGVDYWKSWMLSQEFQVMEYSPTEGVSGDYYAMATAQANVVGDETISGRYSATGNYTSPAGEWTTLELFCYEGKSLHVVNGKLALALENSSYRNGDELIPLVEGKIQLQSEAAEIFYKDIQIKEISALPEIK